VPVFAYGSFLTIALNFVILAFVIFFMVKWINKLRAQTPPAPPEEAALRRKLEARGFRVTRYVYSPGTYFPDHSHDIDKIDAVLSGRFRMTMGGTSVVLEAGDCLAVPSGAVHSAEVVGDEPVVSLDATRD
jgi:quercetin dioxygenase-like cupin family protein